MLVVNIIVIGSNESAICTAPSVDFSPLPHIKNDVQGVKHALEQIMEYEEASSKQEQKFEQELQNITRAQALAELRNERAITELLKLELREAQQLAAMNEINNTTQTIKGHSALIKDKVSQSVHALTNLKELFDLISHYETHKYVEKISVFNEEKQTVRVMPIISVEYTTNRTKLWFTVQDGLQKRVIQYPVNKNRRGVENEMVEVLGKVEPLAKAEMKCRFFGNTTEKVG
jgi:hypothetical protein